MKRSKYSTLIDRFISRYAKPDSDHQANTANLLPMVVVTGGSSGIGKALATRFTQQGNPVVLVARGQEALETAAQNIRSLHPDSRVEIISCDITDDNAARLIETSVTNFGGYIDILVNNAGLGLSGSFVDQDPNDVEALLRLNIMALTKLTHAVLPGMLERGRGGIINISSLGAYVPGPYQATYYASKSYVQSLTEAIAFENRGRGVRLHASLPGPVSTPFHKDMKAEHSLYRWLIPTMSATRTASSIMRSYEIGRRVAVPGIINTVLAFAVRVLPHPISLPIVSVLLQPRRTADKSAKRT